MTKVKIMCEVEGCSEEAKFNPYRFNTDGSKSWIHVCDKHERDIANSNISRARRANEN